MSEESSSTLVTWCFGLARGRLRRLFRMLLGLMLQIIPPSDTQVVHAWPATEENGVEVVRALARRSAGEVVWILPSHEPGLGTRALALSKTVTTCQQRSLRGVWSFLRARHVFYTHGLYMSPNPGHRKIHVNLWHGDGPKKVAHETKLRPIDSTFIVSGSATFGEVKRDYYRLPDDGLLVTGNPRTDVLHRSSNARTRSLLGLDPADKLVLWMPTFREATGGDFPSWIDAAPLIKQRETREFLRALDSLPDGLAVMAKLHPLDAEQLPASKRMRVLRSADLERADITAYELLASADALLTDYSSMWVDFLCLDKPIGYFVPDLREFSENRGFGPAGFEVILAGPLLETAAEAVNFIEAVGRGNDADRCLRHCAVERLGVITAAGATDRLLNLVGLA